MSRYLVTGGAGFIGSHLAEHLLKAGHEVAIVDNFATGRRHNIAPFADHIQLFECDIRDFEALSVAMRGVDYVFHQAALPSVPRSINDPAATHAVNSTGTVNVLIAARDAGVKRVILAGSSSAYGDIDAEYKQEDMPPRVKSPYAASKVAAEQYCLAFNKVYELETAVIRYFNVFGPRQDPDSPYAAVIPLFAKAMLADQAPLVHGDGTQSRDFTYIENVVFGNMLVMETEAAAGEVFNIACGDRISILNLVEQLNGLLGKNIQPQFSAPRQGDVQHSRAAIDKARRLLGYEPRVSFSEGLARTLAWYREQNH